jgi:uncharacterized protein YbjT (DUF2867 family)
MIVVTTPTGHIGSKLIPRLLAAGEPVRVIARDPAKLSAEIRDKVDIIQGSSDDEAVLDRALTGADGFFHLVPPSLAVPDTTKYYVRFTRPAIRALQAHNVQRVVSVSGIGRKLDVDAGPVSAAFVKDIDFERSGLNFRALWCPNFMENMLMQLEPLKQQGAFFLPSDPNIKLPHVATADIAASAARLLLDRTWTGQGGLAVLGPEDLSFNEMAAIMSEVLGKPIRFQPIPGEAYKARLMSFGATDSFAQGLVDMHAAKDKGLDLSEPRTPENTTPTTFRQWCETTLKPALQS